MIDSTYARQLYARGGELRDEMVPGLFMIGRWSAVRGDAEIVARFDPDEVGLARMIARRRVVLLRVRANFEELVDVLGGAVSFDVRPKGSCHHDDEDVLQRGSRVGARVRTRIGSAISAIRMSVGNSGATARRIDAPLGAPVGGATRPIAPPTPTEAPAPPVLLIPRFDPSSPPP